MIKVKICLEVEVPDIVVQECVKRYSPQHTASNIAWQMGLKEKAEAALFEELLKTPWVKKLWEEQLAEQERLTQEFYARQGKGTQARE
jgi:hypothetical protein